MNGTTDPKRLRVLAARGSHLERGLAAARDCGPSDAELHALGAVLFGPAPVANAPAAAKAGSSVWRAAGVTKVVTGLVLAGTIAGVTAAAVHVRRSGAAPPQPGVASARAVEPAAEAAPAIAPPPGEASSPRARRTASPPRARQQAPASAALAPTGTVRQQPAATVSPTGASADGADEELRLIGAAQSALPTDPARSLTLVQEHERRFPDGQLAQEREVVAVSALWKSGRQDEARRRAERFASEHPRSTYVHRMRQILAPNGSER